MINITKYVIYNVRTNRVCVFLFNTITSDLYLYNKVENANFIYKAVNKYCILCMCSVKLMYVNL